MSSKEEEIEKEAIFGHLPLLQEEREWGWLDYPFQTFAFGIATWGFLTGGFIAFFATGLVGTGIALAGILIGYPLAIAGMALMCTKYGVDHYQGLKSIFGVNGTKFPLLIFQSMVYLNMIIVMVMGGRALTNILNTFGYNLAPYGIATTVGGIILTACVWVIATKGPKLMTSFNRIVAPGLTLGAIFILWMIIDVHGVTTIMNSGPVEQAAPFIALELVFGFAFSWWPFMGGFSKFARSQRVSFWGFLLGTSGGAALGILVGLYAALTFGSFDPTIWLTKVGGPVVAIIALAFVMFANISSGVALIFTGAMAIREVNWFGRQRWGTVTAILSLPVVISMLWPEWVYTNFGSVLSYMALTLAPLAGVSFADYILLRKQSIDLRAIFNYSENGGYYFWRGWNWVAIVATITGISVYLLILDPISLTVRLPIFNWATASIPAFVSSAVMHTVLTRVVTIRSGKGAYSEGSPLTSSES